MSSTRDRILDTAIDLFSERGFHDVSVRDLTRAVGIKESSLYNHFRSKQQILDAIYQELTDRFEAMTPSEETVLAMLEKMSLEEFLELSAQSFDRYMTEPRLRKIWRIISIERFRDERARDFFNRCFVDDALEYQARVFDRMIQQGLIKAQDPRVLARESYGFMLFVYFRYLEYQTDTNLGEVKEMVIEHMRFLSQALNG